MTSTADSVRGDTPSDRLPLFNHVCASLSNLDMEMVKSVPPGGNWTDIPSETVEKSARLTQISKSGGRTTYYGRLRPDLPSYTISTYFNRPGNGTFIHPVQDRLISFREAARLQSFPDDYRFLGSLSSMYKQIGNAVPPLVARELGLLIPPSSSVDLFCGAGGLSEGLRMAGHEVLLASDLNPHMCRTYAYNHPQTHVTQVSVMETEHLLDEIELALQGRALGLLAGGPPCQGFSTAGKWAAGDSRNLLAFRMISIARVLRPENVIIENVPGIKWMAGGALLSAITDSLSSIGYSSSVLTLRSEEYGVPQRRRRVFIVASYSGNEYSVPEGSFSRLHVGRSRAEPAVDSSKAAAVTVSEAIDDLPEIVAGGGKQVLAYDFSAAPSDYQMFMRRRISLEEFVSKRAEQC